MGGVEPPIARFKAACLSTWLRRNMGALGSAPSLSLLGCHGLVGPGGPARRRPRPSRLVEASRGRTGAALPVGGLQAERRRARPPAGRSPPLLVEESGRRGPAGASPARRAQGGLRAARDSPRAVPEVGVEPTFAGSEPAVHSDWTTPALFFSGGPGGTRTPIALLKRQPFNL